MSKDDFTRPANRSRTQNPDLKRAKITQAMEMITKGLPQKDTAYLMGVTPRTLRNWQHVAKATGILEEIRDRMRSESLPKSLNVINTILDADVQDLTDKRTVKAHELKLKAAKHMMDVTGVKEDVKVRVTQRMDLDSYAELRAARHTLQPTREAALGGQRVDIAEGGVPDGTPTGAESENYDADYREPGLFPAQLALPGVEPFGGRVVSDHRRDRWQDVAGLDGADGDLGGEAWSGADVQGSGTDPRAGVDAEGAGLGETDPGEE